MVHVKILGAGSIGNHMAHAARTQGWSVCLCDVDPAALERTRRDIYPSRYGAWDDAIELCRVEDAPRDGHDLVVVGTPPDTHVPLALEALDEKPRGVLVEKPLAPPDLAGVPALRARAAERGVELFVGYDHVLGAAARAAAAAAARLDDVQTLDVEFREHWGGIFAAHPWLDGPQDTYLGHWRRGGGASGEHSHAIHLWQHLALAVGAGPIVEVNATLDYVRSNGAEYDRLCLLQLRTEAGLVGRVVQDVVTFPPRKRARLQARDAFVELALGEPAGADSLCVGRWGEEPSTRTFPKTRPDDFITELHHVQAVLEGREPNEPISLERGHHALRVVAAAHASARERRSLTLDPDVDAQALPPARGHSRQEV